MTDVSIIICGYTQARWKQILAAIQSLKEQTLPPLEIIFVSDHNHELFERAQRELKGVSVVKNSGTKGLSDARNTGIRASKGSKIAFLDDDAVAASNWIELLSHWCDQPNVMGAGSRVDPVWMGRKPNWFPDEFYWTVGCSYVGMPEEATSVRNLFGGAMCVRRAIFDKVGGFRVGIGRVGNLLTGCEETELCIRAKEHCEDTQFIYEPDAVLDHHLPHNRETFSYFVRRCYGEGRSKALLSHMVSASSALESELSYALRTLPMGVLRNLRDAFLKLDYGGLQRACVIVLGLGITGVGYLAGLRQARLLTQDKE